MHQKELPMRGPSVSTKRLVDNSLAAMLAAVKVYNKPQVTYRDEVTVKLIVNAWELVLKATRWQKEHSIIQPKKPNRTVSFGLPSCLTMKVGDTPRCIVHRIERTYGRRRSTTTFG